MTSSIPETAERQLITSFRARNEGSIRALLGRAPLSTTNTCTQAAYFLLFLDLIAPPSPVSFERPTSKKMRLNWGVQFHTLEVTAAALKRILMSWGIWRQPSTFWDKGHQMRRMAIRWTGTSTLGTWPPFPPPMESRSQLQTRRHKSGKLTRHTDYFLVNYTVLLCLIITRHYTRNNDRINLEVLIMTISPDVILKIISEIYDSLSKNCLLYTSDAADE